MLDHVYIINSYYLFKHLRSIRRRVVDSKNEELKEIFAKVVIAATKKAVYGNVDTKQKLKTLSKFVKLLRRINTDKFIDENDKLILNLLSSTKGKKS